MALGQWLARVTSPPQQSASPRIFACFLATDLGVFPGTELTYLPPFLPARRVSLPTARCPLFLPLGASPDRTTVRVPDPPEQCLHVQHAWLQGVHALPGVVKSGE